MKSFITWRNILIISFILLNAGCDQVSKVIVRNNIVYGEQIQVIPEVFTLTKIENTGAFLSLGHSLPGPVRVILLLSLPVIVIGIGIVYLIRHKELSWFLVTGIGFAIGGGIGNIFDRLLYGSVTDFMHLDLGLFRTGIFNFGDVSITTGISMILLHSIFGRKTENPPAEEKQENITNPES